VVLQAPQAGAPITVWVKRMDLADARYDFIKNVDPEQLVAELIARWVAEEKLDVRPSLVTLRLVKRGAGKPTPAQEAKAKALDDPRLTLAGAGFTDGCSLLAFVVGTKASAEHFALSANVPGACIACIPLQPIRSAHGSRVWPPQPYVLQTMLCSKRAQSTRTYFTWVHAAQGRAPFSWMQIVRSRRRCCAGSKRFAASGLA